MRSRSRAPPPPARALSTVISGTVVVLVAGFTVAFVSRLGALFPILNSASGFFASANLLFYMSIEATFLIVVVYAAYLSVRRKE